MDFQIVENQKISRTKFEEETVLELFNIGFGAAKNIEVVWDGNIPQILVDKINQVNNDKYDYELKENTLSLNGVFYHDKPDLKQKYEFLLPENKDEDSQFIRIPDSILQLYTIMFLLYKNETIELDCPLNIYYYDVGNKKHVKKYTLKLGMNLFDFKTNKGQLNIHTNL